MSDKQFPIQNTDRLRQENLTVPEPVYMAAYEVYCHVYRPQEAMITGSCRGGFGVGELVGFLYVRSFPKDQWIDKWQEVNRDQGLNL